MSSRYFFFLAECGAHTGFDPAAELRRCVLSVVEGPIGSNEHVVTRHSDECVGSWGDCVTMTGFVDVVISSELKDE